MMQFQKIYADAQFDVGPAARVHNSVPQPSPPQAAGSYQYEVTPWL